MSTTFSLTKVFVAPKNSTLATTGSTQNLTAGQIGIFRPDWSVATAGNAAAAKFLMIAQGRNLYAPGEATAKSDEIYANRIIEWYRYNGEDTARTQITEISGFDNIGCDEDISVTLRAFSFYIDVSYFNGLTRSVQVKTPCCDCGADPCDTLDATDIENVVSELANKLNAEALLKQFIEAIPTLNGTSSKITIYAKPLTREGVSVNPNAYPHMFDAMRFHTWVYKGAELSTDYLVEDRCEKVATVTVLQRATYPRLLAGEVRQIEKDFFSYDAVYKHIFDNADYNGEFNEVSNVDDVVYDELYLKFTEPVTNGWSAKEDMDEAVRIFLPQGRQISTDILAVLTAAYGAPKNESPADISTTTTTSTSSTTTTTTTYMIP